MKTLRDLLFSIPVVSTAGELSVLDHDIWKVTCDSRGAAEGTVFVALRGSDMDGHSFVQDACTKGCRAIVVEREVAVPADILTIRVRDSHQAYGMLAAAFYGHPGLAMNMIGITGTNGKTTTSWIIENMLRAADRKTGVIGTVNYRYPGKDGRSIVREASLTTPEPVILHSLLREMADAGVSEVVMEVSSHALVQQRLAGLLFDIGLFTNLSRDHLDYHRTMEEYFTAKCMLFEKYLKEDAIAVVVADTAVAHKQEPEENWGRRLLGQLRGRGFSPYEGGKKNRSFISCGFHSDCVVNADEPVQSIGGFTCEMRVADQNVNLHSGLIGRHNVLNMLTAAGAGYGLGLNLSQMQGGLNGIENIPGRLERVSLPRQRPGAGPYVFVDYAHTPDALENVLLTLRDLAPGRLICVFGCGGNRDRGKRPLMGSIAGRLADRILVTSDNPRKENPATIIREIEKGLRVIGVTKTDVDRLMDRTPDKKMYALLEDRRQAIHSICSRAEENDVILVAGKGHETYQVTADGKSFFDDRIVVRDGRLRWTVEHLLAATSGQLRREGISSLLGEITTDSRTLQEGDIFIALKGDNFDGHDFAGAAAERGAAVLLVSEDVIVDDRRVAVIQVNDTLEALGNLAAYRRRALAPQLLVTAVTGSSGKTTVKEMTAAIFQEHYRNIGGEPVLKTLGNYNNLIGMPLSLLRANAGHRVAVMEMGMNHPGEIARLTEIAAPDIGCITNIQAAHLEGLGSIEGVARAKGELFAAMSGKGVRVVNYDDRHLRKIGESYGDHVIGFAVTPAGRKHRPPVRATRIVNQGTKGMRFTLHFNDWRKRFTIPAVGEHNVANCAAAAAVALAAGIEQETIVRGLVCYREGDKRLQFAEMPCGIHVLNDAYNANPASMEAALRTLAGFGGGGKKIAVLGDMLELGPTSAQLHQKIGSLVAELGFDFLAATGNFAGDVARGALQGGMPEECVMCCASAEAAADVIADMVAGKKVNSGDWLLLKGSRGMRMEKVLELVEVKLTKAKK